MFQEYGKLSLTASSPTGPVWTNPGNKAHKSICSNLNVYSIKLE